MENNKAEKEKGGGEWQWCYFNDCTQKVSLRRWHLLKELKERKEGIIFHKENTSTWSTSEVRMYLV